MKAGDTYISVLRLLDAAGVAVTAGAAGFTITSYVNGTLTALTASVAEIGAGLYRLSVTLPATTGSIGVLLAHSTAFPTPNRWDGINTTYDIDTVTAKLNTPSSYLVVSTGTLGQETPLKLDAYREQSIGVTIVDSSQVAIPGTGYTNLRMTVRDKNHTGSVNTAITTGVTWDIAGLLTVPIPEDTAFFKAIDPSILRGDDSVVLRYDVIGDRSGVAGNTRTIMRGTLTIKRFEGPA